jgi:hypothetical protein
VHLAAVNRDLYRGDCCQADCSAALPGGIGTADGGLKDTFKQRNSITMKAMEEGSMDTVIGLSCS